MRPKKEPRESFGSTLREDLMIELRNLSSDTNIPISKLLDEAVQLLFEKRRLSRDRSIREIADSLIEMEPINADDHSISKKYDNKKNYKK